MNKLPIQNPLHTLYLDSFFSKTPEGTKQINKEKDKIIKLVEGMAIGFGNIEHENGEKKIYKDKNGNEYTKDFHNEEEIEQKYNVPRSVNEAIEKAKELKNIYDITDYFKYIRIYRDNKSTENIFRLFNIIINDNNIIKEDKKAVLNIFNMIKEVTEKILQEDKNIGFKDIRYGNQYAEIDGTHILMEEELEITENGIIIRKIINVTEEIFEQIKDKQGYDIKDILSENINNINKLGLYEEKEFYIKFNNSMILIKVQN